MSIFIEIFLLIILAFVFIQDLKHRAIHISLPFLIGGIGVYIFFSRNQNPLMLLYNFLFLLVTFFFLYVYLAIKQKKKLNPFNFIGLGDVLFFLAIIPFFSITNYILYFITGMLFSIIFFSILQFTTKNKLVPLAGLLAFYLIILRFINYVKDFDFYDTQLI